MLALKWSSDLQINRAVTHVTQPNSSLNSSAAQQASTCTEGMRSDGEETQTESTDLYQNFRGKTTIGERFTGVPYEIADTDQSAAEQRAASP